MSEPERNEQLGPVRDRTVSDLGAQIAAKRIHVGGGSAAAAAASLAAASAELVVTLSIRKSTPEQTQARLERDSERLTRLRSALLDAADADELALGNLMQAYRSREADMGALLVAAAETALASARLAAEVVEIAARGVGDASRFTVSDLGSAAAIAHGSVEAALLTAEVNFELLAESAPGTSIESWTAEIEALRAASTRAVKRTLSTTRARIADANGSAT